MILTLTPNPSVDRTIALSSELERGEVIRAESSVAQSAGKGVNISRAAVSAGVATIAVVPADSEDPFVLELLRDGIDCRPEAPTGPVRVNITLTEPDGTTTKVNSPGNEATEESLRLLADAVRTRAERASWVVLAGSLPPGAPDGWYADLAASLAPTGAQVAVDTSEKPLTVLASRLGDARPDLMKPNAEELADLTGDSARAVEGDPQVAAKAARQLVDQGAGAVLATLGGAGAVLVTSSGAWFATPPPTTVVSTVGAGDSSLFGYVLGALQGKEPADRLRLAVAYGSAAAGLPGTTVPRPDQTQPELVTIRELDAQ